MPSTDPARSQSRLRVTFVMRGDWATDGGGDTVQVRETARALGDLGVSVEHAPPGPDAIRGADVLHLFHLDRPWENLPTLRAARRAGKPVVLSPIFWPMDELDHVGRPFAQRSIARGFGASVYQSLRLGLAQASAGLRGEAYRPTLRVRAARRATLDAVSVLLPNSEAERAALAASVGALPPCRIVPNGVDPEHFKLPSPASERAGVLCVGRLEPRKNQLALVEALRGSNVPLTFVGPTTERNRRYAADCRRAAGPGVRFLDPLDQTALANLYQGALVHCCPSWYETPGLANLEAALSGCRLVLARRGAMPEYFAGDAVYCEPGSPASIRTAVDRALAEPMDSATLVRRIRKEFSWKQAAARTLEAYERALQD